MSPEPSGPEKPAKVDIRDVYSETVIDHVTKPRNLSIIQDADGFGAVTGACGDMMEIWLRIRNDRVLNASFLTDGCGATIAAGSMVTELAKGKTAAEALRIAQKDILEALGGLPEESQHCALLAADTLKAAVRDYLAFKSQPWKRAYRTR